jgi:hypothetical protein
MPLKDLVVATATVMIPSANGPEPLVLRGLGLDGIMFLLRTQGEAMQSLYAQAVAGELGAESAMDLAMNVLDQSGELGALVIALAAGEIDQWEAAMNLPASVQIEALEKIALLTFAAEGGPKKPRRSSSGRCGRSRPTPARAAYRVAMGRPAAGQPLARPRPPGRLGIPSRAADAGGATRRGPA